VAQSKASVVPTSQQPTKLPYKGLKRHIHFEQYEAIRGINRLTCFNAMLSLVLGIVQNEIHWSKVKVIAPSTPAMGPISEPDNFSTMTNVLKCLVTANVLLVLWGIYRYYSALLELEKLRCTMLPQDTFYSAGYLWTFLLEVFICAIHPLPFVYFVWSKEERGGLYTLYGSDDLFTCLMIPRVYLLGRVFRDFYGLNSENSRYVGTLCRVDLDGMFITFKNLLLEHPLMIVPICYGVTMCTLSYAICVLERPTDPEFKDIRNGIWVIFVTMTTVGYGDLYPRTDLGRTVAVFACASALLILMLLIIGMQSYMAPDAKEFKVFHILKYKRWKRAMKQQGAIVIQSFWRCARMIDRPDEPLLFHRAYVADTKLCFEVRKFRSLRAEEPLEQRDLGNLMWEVYQSVTKISDKLIHVENLFNEQHLDGKGVSRI